MGGINGVGVGLGVLLGVGVGAFTEQVIVSTKSP